MKAYIEVVMLDNFFVDLFLLFAVKKTCICNSSGKILIFISAALGTAYAVIAPMKGFVFLLNPFFKIIISFLMILIAFGKCGFRDFAKRSAILWTYALVLGGSVYFIGCLFGEAEMNGGVLAVSGPPLWLLIVCAAILPTVIQRMHRYIKRSMAQCATSTKVKIELLEKQYTFDGIIDSGNELCDPLDGTPVIVLSKLQTERTGMLKNEDISEFRSIMVNTSTGSGHCRLLMPKRVSILVGKQEKEVFACVGISDASFSKALIPFSAII